MTSNTFHRCFTLFFDDGPELFNEIFFSQEKNSFNFNLNFDIFIEKWSALIEKLCETSIKCLCHIFDDMCKWALSKKKKSPPAIIEVPHLHFHTVDLRTIFLFLFYSNGFSLLKSNGFPLFFKNLFDGLSLLGHPLFVVGMHSSGNRL